MVRRSDAAETPSAITDSDRASAAFSASERRVVLGQPDGAPGDGLEAQMQRAWINLFDAIKAAGYEKRHLVKTTVSVTEGGQLKLYRAVRDRMMRGHVAASAYLHVAGLSAPAHLVEIEGELLRAGG